jgi:hypothetical protein
MNSIIGHNVQFYPEFKNSYTQSQRNIIRQNNIENLGLYNKIYLNDIENTMDIDMDMSKDINIIFDSLIENIYFNTNGEMSNVVFITLDSSFICNTCDFKNFLNNMRFQIKNTFSIKNPFIVLIHSTVNFMENMYKILNIERYNNVNTESIDTYFNLIDDENIMFLNEKNINNTSIDYVQTIDNKLTFMIMDKIETDIYNTKHNNPEIKIQNEVNDNTQVQLLLKFRQKFPLSKTVLYTYDKGLQNIAKENNIYINI